MAKKRKPAAKGTGAKATTAASGAKTTTAGTGGAAATAAKATPAKAAATGAAAATGPKATGAAARVRAPATKGPGTAGKGRALAAKGRAAPGRRPRGRLPIGSLAAWGAIGGMILGAGLLMLGVVGALRSQSLPGPLLLALVISGSLEASLSWATLRRSRAAWSFATALSGTATVAFLFGSAKVRDALEVPILLALVPALVAAVVTTFLAAGASDVNS